MVAIRPDAPETLFAGTNGGVFKSTNGGRSWTAVRLVQTEAAADPPTDPVPAR
jgi:photosystem II stability/assembly factor-like uncharacterized protein